MAKEQNTELKILEAAKRIFLEKGSQACTSREIAKESGMNVALVNYYFRSKGKLFQAVFDELTKEFTQIMLETFSAKMDLEQKVRLYIEREYEFLAKVPQIPLLMISEFSKYKENQEAMSCTIRQVASTGIFEEFEQAQREGKARKMSVPSVGLLILSNCHYPVMAERLTRNMHDLSEEDHKNMMHLHKQHVIEMIISYIFNSK